jgi:hypothetical protein
MVVMIFFVLVTALVFGNFDGKFTICYLGGAAMAALGALGCLLSRHSIRTVRFLNTSGMPALAVIAHRKSKRPAQDAFVAAIQSRLLTHNQS